uniref:Uncharacterized protein n=1 Tax=Avena sativa TaxID=4498 RepID=A0ACD5V228_AVESA
MKCYDPDTSELIIPDRGKIPVDAESVHRIWGLPNSGLKVWYEMNADITRQMMVDYGFPPNGSPDLTSWCKMIEDMAKKSDDLFVRAWSIMAYNFLAPTTGLKVSPRCYPAVYDVELIPKMNICQFVVDQIRLAFSSLKSKKSVCCCVYHLMVSAWFF